MYSNSERKRLNDLMMSYMYMRSLPLLLRVPLSEGGCVLCGLGLCDCEWAWRGSSSPGSLEIYPWAVAGAWVEVLMDE